MYIRCQFITDGPGPSEHVVGIETKSGQEQVVLSTRALDNGYLDIGEPLSREGQNFLIELPRESASGRWRIWVPESETSDDAPPRMIAAE